MSKDPYWPAVQPKVMSVLDYVYDDFTRDFPDRYDKLLTRLIFLELKTRLENVMNHREEES